MTRARLICIAILALIGLAALGEPNAPSAHEQRDTSASESLLSVSETHAQTYCCSCGLCGARLADEIVLSPSGPQALSPHALNPGEAVTQHEITTDHYHLTAHATQAEADELEAVMIAVWDEFVRVFGEEPDLDDDEKLRAYYFQDEASWRAQVEEDCGWCPKAGGYYWPTNKTAYLYKQPTIYFTRMLFIHELMHQFHYLAKTNNRNPSQAWYTEGVAEYVSRHYWDGEALVLGVLPRATLEDYPAKALKTIADDSFDLAAMVSGDATSARPEQWALIRFLATREDKRDVRDWEKLQKKMDRGTDGKSAFKSAVGDPDKLLPDLRAWLADEQEPWQPIWNEWEGIGANGFRGVAPFVTSACRIKGQAQSLSAAIQVPAEENWKAGLLLDYESGQRWVIVLIDSAKRVRVQRFNQGKWSTLTNAECPKPEDASQLKISAKREDAELILSVEGEEIGRYEFTSGVLGLAIQASDIRFHDVEWTLAEPAPSDAEAEK